MQLIFKPSQTGGVTARGERGIYTANTNPNTKLWDVKCDTLVLETAVRGISAVKTLCQDYENEETKNMKTKSTPTIVVSKRTTTPIVTTPVKRGPGRPPNSPIEQMIDNAIFNTPKRGRPAGVSNKPKPFPAFEEWDGYPERKMRTLRGKEVPVIPDAEFFGHGGPVHMAKMQYSRKRNAYNRDNGLETATALPPANAGNSKTILGSGVRNSKTKIIEAIPETEPIEVKRGPGRPPKVAAVIEETEPVIRKRGRPAGTTNKTATPLGNGRSIAERKTTVKTTAVEPERKPLRGPGSGLSEAWHNFGETPTEQEIILARLLNARGSRDQSITVARTAPRSAVLQGNYYKCVERVAKLESELINAGMTAKQFGGTDYVGHTVYDLPNPEEEFALQGYVTYFTGQGVDANNLPLVEYGLFAKKPQAKVPVGTKRK